MFKKMAAQIPREQGESRKLYRERVLAALKQELKDKKTDPRARLTAAGAKSKAKAKVRAKAKGKASGN